MVMKSVSEIGGIPRNRSTPSVLHAKGGGIDGREGGMYGEIWALKRQGYSIRAIARKLGIHRKIVKKYLDAREFPAYRAVEREIGK